MVDETKRNELIAQKLDIQGRLSELNSFIIALHIFETEGYIKLVKEDNSEKNIQEWKSEIDVEISEKLVEMDEVTKLIV